MNTDGQPTNDSDNSSSPAASGSSERDEEASSVESTPPPHADNGYRESKRYSNVSSAYSKSYQPEYSQSAPNTENGFGHYRNWSTSSQALTADTSLAESYPDEDPQELAAAVGLLSCSYGTPKTGPTVVPGDDVPPVPPLPQKYANFAKYRTQEDVIMDAESSDDEPAQPRTTQDDFDGVFGKMDN